ncbi:MAG: hypothetical protein KBC81_00485 [Candidatus Pacebacteria bacterium]|nr:hypothetical protein [Candidatus Paceibacterota bacterium]
MIATFFRDLKNWNRFSYTSIMVVAGLLFVKVWWWVITNWVIPKSTFLSAHYESTWVAISFMSAIVFINSMSGFSDDLFWKWFGPTSTYRIGYDNKIKEISLGEWLRLQKTRAFLEGADFSLLAFSNSRFRFPVKIHGNLAKKWSLKRVIGKDGPLFVLTQKNFLTFSSLENIFNHIDVLSMLESIKTEEKQHIELQKAIQGILESAREDMGRYRSPACQILRENLESVAYDHGIVPSRTWKEHFRFRADEFWKRQETRKTGS